MSVRGVGTESNAMPFVASDLPESIGNEHDDRPVLAQTVSIPVIVNGRINAPGDVGVYRFDGRAGETVVAEVLARRLESPLDSVIKLTDHAGHILAMNDDFVDKGAGLVTHQADSYLMTKLPANGSYTLTIWDAQHKGGPDYAYRLRLSEPRPDFDLRITPSAINVRAGGSTTFDVVAIRRDGFDGDITLALKGAPPGLTISGAWIPAKSDSATVTLTAPPYKLVEPVALTLEGTATVNGQSLRREAIPADDMEQAFAYHHLVPASEWLVSVYGGYQRGPANTRLVKPSKKIQ